MYDQKQKRKNKVDWLFFVIGFILASVLGFGITPAILYVQKAQPFQFSHKLHQEEVGDEGCKFCHLFYKDGSFAGIPSIKICKECHGDDTLGNKVEENVFVEEYIKKDKEVPWFVYAKQPVCVFFSHTAHINSAGLECIQCHGNHGQTENLRLYEYNRLSTYSRDIWGRNILGLDSFPNRMKMGNCADCHRVNTVNNACFVCHK